ncbi:MAG: bifunctional 5,10-methylenetetrahydrofolate dehydrogenase/5,10-methenyltetrahydrofolate cyclohydrolase [Chloroflexi bacterium]|nr:MAG: bifunctional 5,10-methylenetetrahydrofolate dehydrogenase/5,10-methenyltetrahydrofolate cyclohydrolase [Chloroflexota bacterium]
MSRSLAAKPRSTALAAEAARVVAASTAARGGRPAVLAAVVATEEIDALIYMEQLLKQAATAGLAVKKISLAATASEAEIRATLQRLSDDPDVAGIILQSPLPSGVDRARVVVVIDPQKDVDGATAVNAARLAAGDLDGTILPATAAAVMELLRTYEIPLRGQRAVVVGRSAVVGGPVAQLLALAGAQVAVVHSQTPDMGAITRTAQILVVAAGVRGLVRGEHVAPGCVVIDVGIHADGDRIVGDVDAESVSAAIGAAGGLSPVPGGVGPMTNAILVLQAAQAAARRAGA